MTTRIYAEYFRGFKDIEISLGETGFLVGDNSSGKTSILHLIDYVTRGDLSDDPRMDDDLNVGRFDFFSPFFKNADVTIGFSKQDESKADALLSSKFLTLRKDAGRSPDLVVVTFTLGDMAVTLRPAENGAGIRVVRRKFSGVSDIKSLHADPEGDFQHVSLSSPFPLNNPMFAAMCYQRLNADTARDESATRCFLTSTDVSPRHIGPLRGLPENFYRSDRRYLPSGGHFAVMYRDLRGAKAEELRGIVNRFGHESGLFEQMDIEPLTRRRQLEDPPLVVSVTRRGQKFLISQVGIGVSQVAPILVEAVFAASSTHPSSSVLLIQQPELHLHPRAQAALGDFIFEMNRRGLVMIVETHSDFTIDRYRAAHRNDKSPRGAAILFCSSDDNGNRMQRFPLADDGSLLGDTDEYLDFFIKEFERTIF